MRFAFLIFLLVPVIELTVLISVGSEIGALSTIALVFLTAIMGVTIIRSQGLATLMRAQQKMQHGELPATEVAEGFMLALAGLMLLIPGFVTDAIGAVLLISPLRKHIAQTAALTFLTTRMNMRSAWQEGVNPQEGIVEGEFTTVDEDAKKIDKK